MQKYYDCSTDKLSSSTSNLSYNVAFHFSRAHFDGAVTVRMKILHSFTFEVSDGSIQLNY